MAKQPTNDIPKREVKHEAAPGYPIVFLAAFLGTAIYLAIILITSPGSAKHHKKPAAPATQSESGTSN